MSLNSFNFVFINSDSIFQGGPEFEKTKTLSKIPMISRGDYGFFSYLGQQCFKMKSEIAVLLKKFSFGLYSIRYAHALGAFLRGRTNFFSDNTETLK
jgi:hypothetical protein